MKCNCDFKVGDAVDWFHAKWNNKGYYYHGQIVDLNEPQGDGIHWISVKWVKSSRFGKKVRTIPQGLSVVVPNPWIHDELCSELKICQGSGSQEHPMSIDTTQQ